MALEGIDVHDAQGGIDWYRVANDNRAFAFIRAAYGDRVDNLVVQNFVGAKHQGLVCGLYHFYRVTRDAKKQADLMVKILKQSNLGFGKGDLPPVIDVEDNPAYDGVNSYGNESNIVITDKNGKGRPGNTKGAYLGSVKVIAQSA